MAASFSHRLQLFSQGDHSACLRQIHHGIEKEGLRVTPDLQLSQQSHPQALGSALTHPYITTDYSEALLEFITPVYQSPEAALAFLAELHTETLQGMASSEVLWCASMPPLLQGDDMIPVAEYGSSNIGKMKHVYRLGLAHRYGKAMQTIAGIHYNFSLNEEFWSQLKQLDNSTASLQDYQSSGYLALIRNFRRYSWLLSYLFGASPALDRSFLPEGDNHGLESLDADTLYLPWATSLRMGDLGYTSNAQTGLPICYNTLDNYVNSLWAAIHTPYPPYSKIGRGPNGEYRQLNSNLLQIENEYYSPIRPKRVIKSGEKPVLALKERGVEYIEVRSLDINPLLPLGIDAQQARFIDTFLLYCALAESPEITDAECRIISENFSLAVNQGRKPGLQLQDGDSSKTLTAWASELFRQLEPIARLLDRANNTSLYSDSLSAELDKVKDASLTPSAQILAELKQGQSFRDYAGRLSREHSDFFRAQQHSQERRSYFQTLAQRSVENQAEREAQDAMDFGTFLREYFQNSENPELP